MADTNLQNIDISQNNPLIPVPTSTTTAPQNPKKIILIGLSLFFVIILLITAIVSSIQKSVPRPNLTTSNPPTTPTAIPTQSNLPLENIPQEWQDKLSSLDSQNQPQPDFLPPILDPDIGL